MGSMDFMTERITEDAGKAFAPSRYGLKSKNDAIISPYATYDLFFEITFHVLQKLGAYEDIGTPEECRKAMEKQVPKKPNLWGDGYSDGQIVYDMWDCPNCGKNYEVDGEQHNFCPNCGQAIDWESQDMCKDEECPYHDENSICEAAEGCPGFKQEDENGR